LIWACAVARKGLPRVTRQSGMSITTMSAKNLKFSTATCTLNKTPSGSCSVPSATLTSF